MLATAQYTDLSSVIALTDEPDTGVALPATDPSQYGNRPQACILQAEDKGIRWTPSPGDEPTASFGMLLAAGESFLYTQPQLNLLRFIEAESGAKLNVAYYASVMEAVAEYVTSFNGRTGAVTLTQSDVDAALGYEAVQSVVAGDNVTVDATDPRNPIVSATGGGGVSLPIELAADEVLTQNAASDATIGADTNGNPYLQAYDGGDPKGSLSFGSDGLPQITGNLGVNTPANYDPYYDAMGMFGVTAYIDETSASAISAAYAAANTSAMYAFWNLDNIDGNVTGDLCGMLCQVATINGGVEYDFDGGIIAAYYYAEYNGTGQLKNIDGFQAVGVASGGALVVDGESRVSGIGAAAEADGAGTTVTNLWGVAIFNKISGGAAVTNNIGVRINTCSGAENNWNIYSVGHEARNTFEGYIISSGCNSPPSDDDLAAGDMAIWFDSTNGAAKFMVKAKQADGTVKTGSFNVQT